MKVLGLKKAYETIRLDESPDSPEYAIDLSDAVIGEKSKVLGDALADYERVLAEGDRGELTAMYRSVIVAMMGEGAYRDIVAYVGGGVLGAEQVNIVLSPLVLYLLELFSAAVSANYAAAAAKYLRGGGEGAAVL